jgi:hypothetical protein
MPFVEINEYSGASPDGFMVEYGELIEIKCPYNTANHLKTAFEGYVDPKVLCGRCKGRCWQLEQRLVGSSPSTQEFKDERFKLIEIRVEADA